ncbi:hypothetical protein MGYG_00577 [Nannizzia gypsea CBS 118893]|uniref:Uncharacterized protein n=1 Tax=Arthroderma gypseum (strain ATCC MYA-4604 / CBS 118893) TaxID=535722 RepID=E5R0H7_ARTGP|nr:hypothetical protein MGYG_00577 [Nannizzia gypsea CBS 118893]EFQ97536.1 hypothetical protein MGYG_00577 [Nannizzia gypsea CBS 118893]
MTEIILKEGLDTIRIPTLSTNIIEQPNLRLTKEKRSCHGRDLFQGNYIDESSGTRGAAFGIGGMEKLRKVKGAKGKPKGAQVEYDADGGGGGGGGRVDLLP